MYFCTVNVNSRVVLWCINNNNNNNNNNKVYLYCACPYINRFALGTLQHELRQQASKRGVSSGVGRASLSKWTG